METRCFLGTELKMNIHIAPLEGVKMENYDFEIEAYCNPYRSKKIPKKECKQVDDSNYLVFIPTALTGEGNLMLKVIAYVPDSDFKAGVRTEVVEIDTGIEIVKGK